MNPDRLFSVPDAQVEGSRERAVHLGRCGYAAELRCAAHLLERGFNVARPIVDDDGVDLVVDYRTTVQIRATQNLDPRGYLRVKVTSGKPSYRRVSTDVLVVWARTVEAFYVFPCAVLTPGLWFTIAPKYEIYREAWDVFGEPRSLAA